MGYIVDLILILYGGFGSHGNVSTSGIESGINSFASGAKTSIHNDISSFIQSVLQFQYHDRDMVLSKIIDLILQNCDPPPGTYK